MKTAPFKHEKVFKTSIPWIRDFAFWQALLCRSFLTLEYQSFSVFVSFSYLYHALVLLRTTVSQVIHHKYCNIVCQDNPRVKPNKPTLVLCTSLYLLCRGNQQMGAWTQFKLLVCNSRFEAIIYNVGDPVPILNCNLYWNINDQCLQDHHGAFCL